MTETKFPGRTAVYLLDRWVPDRALLPNNVTSARTSDRKRREQRAEVDLLLRQQREIGAPLPERLWCRFTVAWPREMTIHGGKVSWRFKPVPDGDNLNAALKGALDAVADKIGVNDRRIDLLPPVQQRDKAGDGWTLVEIGVRDG